MIRSVALGGEGEAEPLWYERLQKCGAPRAAITEVSSQEVPTSRDFRRQGSFPTAIRCWRRAAAEIEFDADLFATVSTRLSSRLSPLGAETITTPAMVLAVGSN